MKLNGIKASFYMHALQKIFGGFRENNIFKNLSVHLFPFINPFILLLNGLVIATNEGSIDCKCFK